MKPGRLAGSGRSPTKAWKTTVVGESKVHVTEQVVPEPHSSTDPGRLRSSMVMNHGVGPTSAFVVAVKVTDSPSNTSEALAVSETDQPSPPGRAATCARAAEPVAASAAPAEHSDGQSHGKSRDRPHGNPSPGARDTLPGGQPRGT